jgi:tetratricopeptide (TPR) repeat protein
MKTKSKWVKTREEKAEKLKKEQEMRVEILSAMKQGHHHDALMSLKGIPGWEGDPVMLSMIATCCFRIEAYDECLVHAMSAIDLAPEMVEPYGVAAAACDSMGDHKRAITLYSAILLFKPNDHSFRYALLESLFKDGQISSTRLLLEEIERLGLQTAMTESVAATCQMLLDTPEAWDKALTILQSAEIKYSPNDYGMTMIHKLLKKHFTR